MANEALCSEAPRVIKRYTVADGFAIAKGTLLRLSTADLYAEPSSVSGVNDKFAGVAIEEKVASDGIVEIGAAIDGVWEMTCNPAVGITNGVMVALSGANLIRAAVEADFPLGTVIGKALETASASEVIRVRVGFN